MKIKELAKIYAIRMHDEANCKYDEKPYEFHLQMAVDFGEKYIHLIENFYDKAKIIGAIWCHDIIEDCRQTYNDVKNNVGSFIANIVYNVSDELGKNRKERSLKTYPKILNDPYALFVKLCDRAANASYGKINKNSMYNKYKKEYPFFRYIFREHSLKIFKCNEFWNELNELHDFKI